MKFCVCIRRAVCDDLRFALRCRVLDAHIETASPDRIAKTSLFVAGQNDEWDASGFDCSEFGNRELPGGEDLQQHCFKTIIYFVEFVDEEHARSFALEGAHERTWAKEVTPLQTRLNRLPVLVLTLGELHIETLQTFIEASNGLVLTDTAITLKALHMRICCGGDGQGKLRLARPRWSFEQ